MSTPLRFAIFGVALAAIAVLLFKSFTVSPSAAPVAPTPSPANSLANLPAGAIAIPTQLAPAFTNPTPDPNATWAPVFQASGDDNQKTPTFRVSSGTVKLSYRLDLTGENKAGLLVVYMLPEGQPSDQAGLPDVFSLAGVDDSKILSRPAGNYMLSVQALGGTWKVDVEEQE
jgi:hypothetical protein